MNNHPENSRCGVAAVIGAPNAGKSTLVNNLVGQKVAITSAKAQTTRARMTGIALLDDAQILLSDTPGLFSPSRRLDRAMVQAAWDSLAGVDVVVLVVDASRNKDALDEKIIERLLPISSKVLVLNKVDRANKAALLALAQKWQNLIDADEVFFTDAVSGDGVPELKEYLANAMPKGPWHFPQDEVSDVSERMLASEITREHLYRQLHAELPYAAVVIPESYSERRDGSLEIRQQILVERDSQKAIILGKSGARIKEIGAASRAELAELLERKVHLFLHVKTDKAWSEKQEIYDLLGLERKA